MYFRLFSLSQKKTNCYFLIHHPRKNVTTLPCKMHNFFHLTEGMLYSSKRWWLWKKPVVGWHWWLWKEPVVMCGKWNVRQATLQQMFKVTTFCTDTCFQSFSDKLHRPPRPVKIQPKSKMLPQLVRIADWYSICVKKWKRWKICAFYKVVQLHFQVWW